MSRLYTSLNKIKFTHISENYQIPRTFKNKLSPLYSNVITYVVSTYNGTMKYKTTVVKIINILTYAVLASEPLPFTWSASNPFINIPEIDDDQLEEVLGDLYLTEDSIEWDVKVVDDAKEIVVTTISPYNTITSPTPSPVTSSTSSAIHPIGNSTITSPNPNKYTRIVSTPSSKFDISDLYIQAPEVPQFDVNKPWLSEVNGMDKLTIYTTLPEVPKRQRDISITTNPALMTDQDLLNLFPDTYIHTRATSMYANIGDALYMDPNLGIILPIDDYTQEQCIENIIQYPHFYKLVRYSKEKDEFTSFYENIEIDGELVPTLQIWNELDISKKVPYNAEFIKEYLVRKYLMDRDIKHVQFKYPLYGTLNPYLTLFMPASEYEKRGLDSLSIARQCVESRISYKQSRSPILRRLGMINE